MRDFLNQIQQALTANLYYVALFAGLAIPDICGALQSTNGRASKAKYVNWFDRYVAGLYAGNLTGQDCYYYRCSALHQGSSQNPQARYLRILFIEPSATTNVFHNNVLNNALNIDVRIFCNDIISGALLWLQQHQNTPTYLQNHALYMKRYPNGLPPYIVGVPVIS